MSALWRRFKAVGTARDAKCAMAMYVRIAGEQPGISDGNDLASPRRVLALSSLAAASCLHPGSPDGKSTSLFLLLVPRGERLLMYACRSPFRLLHASAFASPHSCSTYPHSLLLGTSTAPAKNIRYSIVCVELFLLCGMLHSLVYLAM